MDRALRRGKAPSHLKHRDPHTVRFQRLRDQQGKGSDSGAVMRKSSGYIKFLAAIAFLGMGSASAEESPNWKLCSGHQSSTVDQRLAACNAIIDSGNEPPPNLALAYCDRAIAYNAKGDPDRAMADLNEAVRLDTEQYTSLTCRGYQYYYRKDFDQAIKDFDKAISSNSRRAEGYVARGSAYRSKGDLEHAIADYSEAIQRSSNNALALYSRGSAFLAQKDNDRAIADFNAAIALDPRMSVAYVERGRAFWAKGDKAHANSDFEEARQLRKLTP